MTCSKICIWFSNFGGAHTIELFFKALIHILITVVKAFFFVSWRSDHKLAWQYALKDGFHGGTNFDTFFFAFYCQSLSNARFLSRKYEQFYFPAKSEAKAYSDQNTINCVGTLRFLKNVWVTRTSEYIMSRRVLTFAKRYRIEARASSWLSFSRLIFKVQVVIAETVAHCY